MVDFLMSNYGNGVPKQHQQKITDVSVFPFRKYPITVGAVNRRDYFKKSSGQSNKRCFLGNNILNPGTFSFPVYGNGTQGHKSYIISVSITSWKMRERLSTEKTPKETPILVFEFPLTDFFPIKTP